MSCPANPRCQLSYLLSYLLTGFRNAGRPGDGKVQRQVSVVNPPSRRFLLKFSSAHSGSARIVAKSRLKPGWTPAAGLMHVGHAQTRSCLDQRNHSIMPQTMPFIPSPPPHSSPSHPLSIESEALVLLVLLVLFQSIRLPPLLQ